MQESPQLDTARLWQLGRAIAVVLALMAGFEVLKALWSISYYVRQMFAPVDIAMPSLAYLWPPLLTLVSLLLMVAGGVWVLLGAVSYLRYPATVSAELLHRQLRWVRLGLLLIFAGGAVALLSSILWHVQLAQYGFSGGALWDAQPW